MDKEEDALEEFMLRQCLRCVTVIPATWEAETDQPRGGKNSQDPTSTEKAVVTS
jgi:hypothetical protein